MAGKRGVMENEKKIIRKYKPKGKTKQKYIRGITMFREMRRKDREIDVNEAKEILRNSEYGVLSTVGENGYPYGVPVNYVYVDDAIYFHCAIEGYKLDNISYNHKVSFCVVGETSIISNEFSTNYESVVVFGKAEEAYDDEKDLALLELIKKYSPEYIEKGKKYIKNAGSETKVIKISIEYISGKARR